MSFLHLITDKCNWDDTRMNLATAGDKVKAMLYAAAQKPEPSPCAMTLVQPAPKGEFDGHDKELCQPPAEQYLRHMSAQMHGMNSCLHLAMK